MNVYKRKKESIGDLAQTSGCCSGEHDFSFCLNVTTVWEEYTSEGECVTTGRASVGQPKSHNSILGILLSSRRNDFFLPRVSIQRRTSRHRCAKAVIFALSVRAGHSQYLRIECGFPALFSTDPWSSIHAFLQRSTPNRFSLIGVRKHTGLLCFTSHRIIVEKLGLDNDHATVVLRSAPDLYASQIQVAQLPATCIPHRQRSSSEKIR
jgi:hypothetical protein